MWEKWFRTPAAKEMSEFEFARDVALPFVCHTHLGMDTLTRGPIRDYLAYADLKQIKARRKLNLEYGKGEWYKRVVLEPAARIAKTEAVPPTPDDDPDEQVEVGRLEQPPRDRDPRLIRFHTAAARPLPFDLTKISPQAVLIWAEQVTDAFADEGHFPTIGCLIDLIHRRTSLDRDEAVVAARTLAALFHTELEQEKAELRRMVERAERPPPAPEEPQEERPPGAPKVRPTSKFETRTGAAGAVTVTEGKKGGKKYRIWGHPVTAVLRWMGGDAWTFDDARTALKLLGVPDVGDNTVKAQLLAGRKGGDCDGRGPAAPLSMDQQNTLNLMIEEKTDGPEQVRGGRPAGEDRAEAPGAAPAGRGAQRAKDGKTRPPVRPADEPARVRGRTGGAAPRPVGDAAGVGGKRAKRAAGHPEGNPPRHPGHKAPKGGQARDVRGREKLSKKKKRK
jgi:hypothetical protein